MEEGGGETALVCLSCMGEGEDRRIVVEKPESKSTAAVKKKKE